MQIRNFKQFIQISCAIWLLAIFNPGLNAGSPYIRLGPATNLATSQPLVDIEITSPGGQSYGPTSSSRFLLDTGANGILIAGEAIGELSNRGYQTETNFFEQGVGGLCEFDLSSPNDFHYTDANGTRLSISDSRYISRADLSFCQLGLCPFYGVAGMPLMEGRVTSLDLTTGSLLDALGLGDGIKNVFSNNVPNWNGNRFTIPVKAVHFEPEGDGPFPTWADLPFLSLDPVHHDIRQTGDFVLDTGAQLSIISTAMALSLGLDTNGNGSVIDEATSSIPIGGVCGQVNAPQLFVDELRIPTAEGVELIVTDVQFAVIDIHPSIDGVFGMNFLAGSPELGGILGGGDGDNYYQNAHFDFREMGTSGVGSLMLDLFNDTPGVTIPPGSHGDLNNDGTIDFADRRIWVEVENGTYFGDSNFDGVFNSTDLVAVFSANEYEDDLIKNSTWATGDWNGDMEFNTTDLVLAFQENGYEQPRRALVVVPEPHSVMCTMFCCLSMFFMRGRADAAK